jgi:hypothetical protein
MNLSRVRQLLLSGLWLKTRPSVLRTRALTFCVYIKLQTQLPTYLVKQIPQPPARGQALRHGLSAGAVSEAVHILLSLWGGSLQLQDKNNHTLGSGVLASRRCGKHSFSQLLGLQKAMI